MGESAGIRMMQPQRLAPNGQRRQDHGQGKAEGFHAHFLNALQNAHGDRGARAGESAEGKTQTLDRADHG